MGGGAAVRTAQTPRMQRCQDNQASQRWDMREGRAPGRTARRRWQEQGATLSCQRGSSTVVLNATALSQHAAGSRPLKRHKNQKIGSSLIPSGHS